MLIKFVAKALVILTAASTAFLIPVGHSFAQTKSQVFPSLVKIEQMEDVPMRNDFSIGPTKFSYDLAPGREITAVIQVTSRLEKETEFEVGVEDFVSQEDPLKYTKFLGNEKSQFSSKEWFYPLTKTFSLKHGERIYLPVKITVPENAEAGDHYSAVFVKTVPKDGAKSGFTFSSRAGSLFLISVAGETKTKGSLISFDSDKTIYTGSPINFKLNFSNKGDVHLIPFGKIIIKDIFGKTVDTIMVDDWVVLRNSERIQSSNWNPKFIIGKYTATVLIVRGYDNLYDTKTISFYVIPIKAIIILFGVFGILGILIKLITSKIEIKRKK